MSSDNTARQRTTYLPSSLSTWRTIIDPVDRNEYPEGSDIIVAGTAMTGGGGTMTTTTHQCHPIAVAGRRSHHHPLSHARHVPVPPVRSDD
jgi:hypothetical protein